MGSDASLIFTDFFVGFVDVLGYRERLRQIHEVPNNDAGRSQVISILRETYGRGRALTDAFGQLPEGGQHRVA